MNTPERDRGRKIQERHNATVAEVQADTDLTTEAKSRRLAQAYVKAAAELGDLRAEERDRLARREAELERHLFGALNRPEDAISSRDAQDRAERLTTPAEAGEALRRAEQADDQVLAGAITHHAVRRSRQAVSRQATQEWDAVLAAYVDARPAKEPVVRELAEIERGTNGRDIFGPFHIAQPAGVLSADINAARSEQTGGTAAFSRQLVS